MLFRLKALSRPGCCRLHSQPAQRRRCAALLHNYKATVTYDGTHYYGFQVQHTARTIQGELERCLTKILQTNREQLKLTGSGRTDAGVHATGQVINFISTKPCSHQQLWHSLNRLLPPDIRVLDVQPADPAFNARFRKRPDKLCVCIHNRSAVSKEYRFQMCIGPLHDPFLRDYSQHIFALLNLAAMRQAAQCFVGSYDFTQFSNCYPQGLNPCKTLTRFDIHQVAPNLLRFEVEGSGFLYKMVRHMVGALIAVGTGKMEEARILELLALGSKEFPGEKYRGWTVAEAKGLFLHGVRYDG